MPNYPAPKPISYWQTHSPKAVTDEALLSIGKLSVIRGVGKSQRIYVDDACQFLFGCLPHLLNWQAANSFIAWLKAQPMQDRPSSILHICPSVDCYQLQKVCDGYLFCTNGHQYKIVEVAA